MKKLRLPKAQSLKAKKALLNKLMSRTADEAKDAETRNHELLIAAYGPDRALELEVTQIMQSIPYAKEVF
jgi:hypothetical protein